jgi:hypothetical protein
MAVERVKSSPDALLLVALLGHGEIVDARKRLACRGLRSRPGLVLH